MSATRRYKLYLVTATVLVVTQLYGCAVGPDFKRPDPPAAKSYSPVVMPDHTVAKSFSGGAQSFDPKKDIPYDWWTLFQSPQLNALIERAFNKNSTITMAQAALHQAQQNVIAQQGFFYPTVGINYMPSRNKLAGNLGGNSPGVQGNGQVISTYSNPAGPAPYNAPVYYDFHIAQLSVGYVPDVFGLNARQVESMKAQENAAQFQLAATYITLASNIVAAAIQEASLRSQIAAIEKIIAVNQNMLGLMTKQLELGYESGIDVETQKAALAQAEQSIVPVRQQLELTRDLIRALADNQPDEEVPETFTLESLHLPIDLPLTVPSKLVEQRPDVRMAEEQLHAASALYGVAIANRLPQFMVTGVLGGAAATPGQMFQSGGGFFNLTGDIAQTIFDGGTLRAKSLAAKEALTQAGAQYQSTVITALQNVADTLHAIHSDAVALEKAAQNEKAMCQVRDMSHMQYEEGFVNYQILLAAEQNYQQSVVTLVQAQTNRLGDTAALYQALGGGWWNKPTQQVEQAKN